MKNIYMIIVMVLLSAGSYAQNIYGQPQSKLHSMQPLPWNNNASPRSGAANVWLDYDSADTFLEGENMEQNVPWKMNKRFSKAGGDSINITFQRVIVSFDSLYDLNSDTVVEGNVISSITVDSIYTELGHMNTSGTNDTLIVKIINLSASAQYPNSHYPGTTTLWADTMVTDSSWSPGGDWLNFIPFEWKPGYTVAGKSFAIELDYYGMKQDTCGFVAGADFGLGTGACAGGDIAQYYSIFWPNSYAAWTQYQVNAPLFPEPTGDLIFIDCNQNQTYDPGTDGVDPIQNILIGAFVTVNLNVGIPDLKNTGIALYQNVPNPLHGAANITYQLANNAKEVTLSVYGLVGNKVMEVNEGNKASGKYTVHIDASALAKGIYTYTLTADGSQLTKRMVVE